MLLGAIDPIQCSTETLAPKGSGEATEGPEIAPKHAQINDYLQQPYEHKPQQINNVRSV